MHLFGQLTRKLSASIRSATTLGRAKSAILCATSGTFVLGAGAGFLRSRQVSKCDQTKSEDENGGSDTWLSLQGLKSQLETITERFSQISAELSCEPGSLYHEVVEDSSSDFDLHPELAWAASVRVGTEIGLAERAFKKQRRRNIRKSFAKLIGVDESIVDERDLPVVGVAASGGGYRAMTFTTGCLLGARNSGILDVTSYVAGISGSCWALAVWYSLAEGNLDRVRTHLMNRMITPFLDLSNLGMFVEPPTNKYLLSGLITKASNNFDSLSLVDIYGTLVSSRLLVPEDLSQLNSRHLKLSHQRRLLDGSLPLPIYCAIHHHIPNEEGVPSNPKEDSQDMVLSLARSQSFTSPGYHWYELTPFEVGSQDVGAFIPTWALGRVFEDGKDIKRSPEISLSVLNGIFASAFTATLAHYYHEVKPGLTVLPFFSALENYVSRFETDLAVLHPFPPAELPNFLYGLHGQLKSAVPPAVVEKKTIGLLDAGAELNIPYVPLYRRECDVIISLDASADSQDLWFMKAEKYAKKFGMKTWPSVKYPETKEEGRLELIDLESKRSEVEVEKSREQALSAAQKSNKEKREFNKKKENPFPAKKSAAPARSDSEPPLGICNIWVGDSEDPKASRMDRVDEDLVMKRNGPALVYIPLTPGEGLVNPSELWSTWNFSYTPDQTSQLMSLSEKNFRTGEEEIIKVLRAVWKRKRNQRLESEKSK